MLTLEPDGTLTFTVWLPDAHRVDLFGAFDGWHEQPVPMRRTGRGLWVARLTLAPGEYLYRYRVDGEHFLADPGAHGSCLTADGVRKSRAWCPPANPESRAA